MGKGGPQPAHQVRPGDLQLEEAVLDLEDPEIFGHIMVPVDQLLISQEVPHMERRVGELLDDDGDDDENDDDELRDKDDETIDEHNLWEGPNNTVVYNLNNNAKKSRKSTRKYLPSVLHRVDILLQEIIYQNRGSKWQPAEEAKKHLASNDEFMNKTFNNKYLSSIEEEEEAESKEQTHGNCQPKEAKKNKEDPGLAAAESPHGTVSKRRFSGGRRPVTGLWRGTFFDTTRPVITLQQNSLCGHLDYRELRKGMGDVLNNSSETNLATISENDKAQVNNGDREFQSLEKLSGDPSTPEEMDHTTAAEFSSFLDLGSNCWNAENVSQTTLIDEDTLCSALSSPKDEEKPTALEDAKVCHLNQELVPPLISGWARFREDLKKDTNGVNLEDKKQFHDIPEERNSCAEQDTIYGPQNSSSDEPPGDLPACPFKVRDHVSPKPTLPSISSSRKPTGAISKNSKIRYIEQTNSKPPLASLVKEYKCKKLPKREKSHRDLKNNIPEDLTQNHSNSQPLEGFLETLEPELTCDQDKYSKRSFTKSRNLSKLLKPDETEKNIATKQYIEELKGTASKHHTQKAVATLKHEIIKVSGKETDKSGACKSLMVQDRSGNTKSATFSSQDAAQPFALSVNENAKHNVSPVHDNAKPNNFCDHDNAKPYTLFVPDNAKPDTISIQTAQQILKSTLVERGFSESIASAENRGPSTTHASNFVDLDMQRTASDRVLSKLLTSKQSQEQRETKQCIFYKSKGIQANTAPVHRRKRLSSHQKPCNSVPLPPIGELTSTCYDPKNPQLSGEHTRIHRKRPKKTLGMYDNLNKDMFDDINKKVSSNLTNESYNQPSVTSPVVTKTHISLEKQARSPALRHSNILSATKKSKVNANVNSTSSYRSTNGQEQEDFTSRMSSDNQAVTDSRISSASTSSKRSTSPTLTALQERNASAFSYFSNSSVIANSPNHESSVDGEWYPKKKAAISSFREIASQTHEDELVGPTSVRKIECHHIHLMSECPPSLVDEQETQTETTIPKQDTNLLPAPDSVNTRYNFEKPLASTSSKEKPESPKFHGKDKKKTTIKKRRQAKKTHPNGFMQEDWQPLTSVMTRQSELSDNNTSTIPPSSANTQQFPPSGSENVQYFTTTYRETFQNPEILKNSHKTLDPLLPNDKRAGVSQKNTLLESFHKNEDKQNHKRKPSHNEALKRSFLPNEDFNYVPTNHLHNHDPDKLSGTPVDKHRRSVSFLGGQVPAPPAREPPPPENESISEEPEISIRLQRTQTAPSSFANIENTGDLGDVKRDEKSSQFPDKWNLNYTSTDPLATMIERRKYTGPQLLPSRLYADSYYDPANNVISVVVKPVDVNINKRLRNIKVKIYRSPPRLPSINSMTKQQHENKEKECITTHSSVPLSRNIIDRRAANPPFNTTTSQEADERYHRMFGHWRIL